MPFLRKYATLTVTGTTAIQVPIIARGVVDFAIGTDWTPATGDVKIIVDGTAAANVTNLPTAVTAGDAATWQFILTAAELTGKSIRVVVCDQTSPKVVEDQSFIVETFGHASAMYPPDFSAAVLPVNVTQLLGTAWLSPAVAGTPDVSAIGDLTATMKTSVNTEVVDALSVDTIADLSQGLPPATPTLEQAIMYLYSALRNKGIADKTAGEKQFYNDADVLIWKKAVTKTATAYTEAEGATGP